MAILDPAQVLAAIQDVARRHLAFTGELLPPMRLLEDLQLDSLRRLTLAAEVENRFRVRLEPEDEATIVTVADLVATVRRKLLEEAGG